MGVAVLNPRDCLQHPFPNQRLISPTSLKQPKNPNRGRSNRSPPSRKKVAHRSNTSPPPPPPAVSGPTAKNLMMGQVKILKRGEELEPEVEKVPDMDLGSTNLMGPDPELMASQIGLADMNGKISGFYAGSGFFVSPPPSSLPMPLFFAKKGGDAAVENDATTKLRQLLRLDL